MFEFPAGSVLGGRREGRGPRLVRAVVARFPTTTFTLRSVSVDNILALGGTTTIHVGWDLEESDTQGGTVTVSGVTALRQPGQVGDEPDPDGVDEQHGDDRPGHLAVGRLEAVGG